MIIAGDRDVTRLEHAIELSRLFPDARLLVLPGGHGDYVAEASSAPTDTDYAEITARLVEPFLDVNDPRHQRDEARAAHCWSGPPLDPRRASCSRTASLPPPPD